MTLARTRWGRLSLRSRLTVLAVGAVAVAVVGLSLVSLLLVRAKLYQQFDDQLQSYSRLAACTDSPAAALAALQADAARPDQGGRRGPDRKRYDLTVQFLDPSGAPTGVAGDERAIPVTERARQTARGTAVGGLELVRIGPDRYRTWTTARAGGGAVQVARDSEGVEDTLAELGVWHGIVDVVGVLAAAVIGRAVARAALRPVDALTAAAEDVARTQDLSGIAVTGTDEIARLGGAFNAMLAALAESRDAQRRLIQDAGHELRTPLASLRNNIELLVHVAAQTDPARVLPAEDRQRLLADLDRQTAELSTLIGELVDLSTGDRSPEVVEDVHLADVVGAAVERARARAPRLTHRADLADVTLPARPASLERAVLNLLDNAAKWSPPTGAVTVRVSAGGGFARIEVEDEGPGIDEADVPHVFERFYRADAARALPGSGLGLAIVEQVAAQHGGRVEIGRGATGGALVTIVLPLSQPNPARSSSDSHVRP